MTKSKVVKGLDLEAITDADIEKITDPNILDALLAELDDAAAKTEKELNKVNKRIKEIEAMEM